MEDFPHSFSFSLATFLTSSPSPHSFWPARAYGTSIPRNENPFVSFSNVTRNSSICSQCSKLWTVFSSWRAFGSFLNAAGRITFSHNAAKSAGTSLADFSIWIEETATYLENLNHDPLHFVQSDFISRPIVEFCRSRRLVRR